MSEIEKYPFDMSAPDAITLKTAVGLADAATQYLSSLKWPEQLAVAFERNTPAWENRSKNVVYPAPSSLYLRAGPCRQELAIEAEQAYDFDLQLATSGIFVDRSRFTLARPKIEGFYAPWMISIRSLERVVFSPQVRARGRYFGNITASACANTLKSELHDMRRNELRFYTQHLTIKR